MRLLLAELRKVWGQRIFALCLAVLAAANLFLLYIGTRPGENSPQPAAWRAVARDLAGMDTQAQQDFINEKLDLVYGVLQIDQILSYQASGAFLGMDVRQEYADLFNQYEQAYKDKTYDLYTGDLRMDYRLLSQIKEELDTVAGYPQFLEDVQAKAKQLSGISIFNNGKSSYDRANIDKTAAVYAGMGDVTIQYAPPEGSVHCAGLPVYRPDLAGCNAASGKPFVRQERDSGMLNLVRSMPGGRLHTALAKSGSAGGEPAGGAAAFVWRESGLLRPYLRPRTAGAQYPKCSRLDALHHEDHGGAVSGAVFAGQMGRGLCDGALGHAGGFVGPAEPL